MDKLDILYKEFNKNGGILKTSELNDIGFSSRQIKNLIEDNVISRIKYGYYELSESTFPEEAIIARLFPQAVIYLESALLQYDYTDRIPSAWQIAVDRNSAKSKYKIDYPLIEPFYLKPNILEIGVDLIQVAGVTVKIFNRDRTICDVLRYENKLEREVVSKAIQRYVNDSNKNIRRLLEYGERFNIHNKLQTYLGVWL